MTMLLRWRIPARPLATRWRGPMGMMQAIARDGQSPLAAIVGPPGPPGSASSLRIDAPLSATWTLPHPLGRVPIVQVFLANGEPVLADVSATPTSITVTHSAPQQGFVLVF
jgi:hypothetical protein